MGNEHLDAFLAEIAALPEFSGSAASATMRSPAGTTPLHIAAGRGDVGAICALLDAGADPNASGERKRTPLHEALERGRPQAARVLIAAGASLDAAGADGVTARDMAKTMRLWEGEH